MQFFFLNYVVSPLYFLPQIAYLRFKNSILLFHCFKLCLVACSTGNFLEKISDSAHKNLSLSPNGARVEPHPE